MPIYKYTALTATGELVSKSITSIDKESAENELLESGLFVTSINRSETLLSLNSGLSIKQKLILVKSLVSLLNSGLPLREALIAVAEQSEQDKLKHYVDGLISSVSKGYSLADACKMYPEAFDQVFTCTIEVGEKTGSLSSSLRGLHQHLLRQFDLSKKVKSALTYPLFLLATLFVVVSLLFVYVVPSFAELFSSFDAELPTTTRVVLVAAESFPSAIIGVLVAIVLGLIFRARFRDSTRYQLFVDSLLLKTPIIGPLIGKSQAVTVATTLGSLIESGASITESLEICARSLRGTKRGKNLQAALASITNGGSLTAAFEDNAILTGYTVKILAVGEKSSNVEQSLKDITGFLQDELNEFVAKMTSLLEPLLILIMGVLMGFIIISMYLPVFFISEVVQ